MIGSDWAERKQRLKELETEVAFRTVDFEHASEAREALEEDCNKNAAELERLPELLREAQAAAAASQTRLEEAQRQAARASYSAHCAEEICKALQTTACALDWGTSQQTAFSIVQWLRELPWESEEKIRAVIRVEAVAKADPESGCDLRNELDNAARHLTEVMQLAQEASERLKDAERQSKSATESAAWLKGQDIYLKRNAQKLAPQLERAKQTEAVAEGPYVASTTALFELKQEHEAAESSDLSQAAEDDATYVVIRVDAECEAEDLESDGESLDEGLDSAMSTALAPARGYFARLGAVRCWSPIGSASAESYYLTLLRSSEETTALDRKLNFGHLSSRNAEADGIEIEFVGTVLPASDAYKEIVSGSLAEGGDGMPAVGESRSAWLRRVAVDRRTIDEALEYLQLVNGNIECSSLFLDCSKPQPVEYAVDGFVAYGCVSEFAALGGTGKSTFAAELMAAFSSWEGSQLEPVQILGAPIYQRGGVAAYIYAEDPESEVVTRINAMQEIWPGRRPITLRVHGREALIEALRVLENLPPYSVVVLDPGGKYLDGPDTDTSTVNRLFAILEAYAARRLAAVIVMHHMTKGGLARGSSVRQCIKGATGWVDNPRATYAMFGRGQNILEVILAKGNLSGLRWREGQGMRFRKDRGRLIPIETSPTATATDCDTIVERVYSALITALTAGRKVHQSGVRFGIYYLKLPELEGLSRKSIEDAVAVLIASLRIEKGPDGLRRASTGGSAQALAA